MSYVNAQPRLRRGALVLMGAAGAMLLLCAIALMTFVEPAEAQTGSRSSAGLPNAAAQRFDMIREQRRTNELLERIATQLEKRESPTRNAATTGRSSVAP